MNREFAITAQTEGFRERIGLGAPNGKRACLRLALATCLTLLAACTPTGTVVDHVWRDNARKDLVLGKTLVVALLPDTPVAIPLENEWVRQLQQRGVDAHAANTLLPGKYPPDEQAVVKLLKTERFTTLLVSRLIDVKQVERDVPAYQVAVVETGLYDVATEQRFWSARSDTYLVSHTGDRVQEPRSERIREFVATLIEAMSSKSSN